MLLLKSGAKFYALTWKDLQDILFMGKKNVAECWRALDFICVSKYTHIHRHTDMCTNRCAYTQTHTHTHTHTPVIMHILKMKKLRDFPGGSVVKSPRF